MVASGIARPRRAAAERRSAWILGDPDELSARTPDHDDRLGHGNPGSWCRLSGLRALTTRQPCLRSLDLRRGGNRHDWRVRERSCQRVVGAVPVLLEDESWMPTQPTHRARGADAFWKDGNRGVACDDDGARGQRRKLRLDVGRDRRGACGWAVGASVTAAPAAAAPAALRELGLVHRTRIADAPTSRTSRMDPTPIRVAALDFIPISTT